MEIVTITFEMDEKTVDLFRQSSIERVINTSLRMITASRNIDQEDKDINLDDWEECKPVVCTFWASMNDAIFRIRAGQTPKPDPYIMHKGEIR